MFDVLSLIEMGYGVAGEITCWATKQHREELVKALRWRRKYHPNWKFTICLDNDEETKSGHRPGNEAAEQLAIYLWGQGLDVKWVKHDPAMKKVDINQLHQEGRHMDVLGMLQQASPVSKVLEATPDMCFDRLVVCLNEGDYGGARQLFKVIQTDAKAGSVAKIFLEMVLELRQPWDFYYDGIKDMFIWEDKVYVVHDRRDYGDGERHYDVFSKSSLIDNLREYQRNRELKLKWNMIAIPSRRPTFRVAREPNHRDGKKFNLFLPSPMLLQAPDDEMAFLPTQWQTLMDNLATPDEQEWLLNHMATYVQTLEKPRTIPVCVGCQGSGKNTLFECFGRGVGGFVAVGNDIIETQFNEWLMHPVILLDEFFTDSRDSRKLKTKLKGLINERQTVNVKHEKLITCAMNNYIAISSNEQVTCAPVIVEDGDRRYTIIHNRDNVNLSKVPGFDYAELIGQLPDFMLYLLSRTFDRDRANTPLHSDIKQMLMEMTEDERVVAVREWVETHRAGADDAISQKAVVEQLNDGNRFRYPISAQKLRPIMEHLGCEAVTIHNQWHYRGLSKCVQARNEDSAIAPVVGNGSTSTVSAGDNCGTWAAQGGGEDDELGFEGMFGE
jgi:hypothetical protein